MGSVSVGERGKGKGKGPSLFGDDPDLWAEASDLLKRLERERADNDPSSSSVIPASSKVVSQDVFDWESATFDDVCCVIGDHC